MTTAGETPGEATLAAASPVTLATEVADYTSVPPAKDFPFTSPEAGSKVKQSTSRNYSNLSSQGSREWDYARKGGGDFNMEAPILEEDVNRAGGLGSRDEIDCFLPGAVDATDYEESLKNAMEYEDVQPISEDDIPRPGVGFVKNQVQNEQIAGLSAGPQPK